MEQEVDDLTMGGALIRGALKSEAEILGTRDMKKAAEFPVTWIASALGEADMIVGDVSLNLNLQEAKEVGGGIEFGKGRTKKKVTQRRGAYNVQVREEGARVTW